jgi:uncharacterized protein
MSLKPWREVAVPHRDVLEGNLLEAEFAADLTKVVAGTALPEYQDPALFFERTYITEGMALLLDGLLKRLSGRGGDPVVQLKTSFGGGKTHTMNAAYHVAMAEVPARDLPGVPPLLDAAGVAELPRARVVVLDGNELSPSQPRRHDGIEARTLWGELACQLGGEEAYALVAESDRDGTSPGKAVLKTLFERYSPCLILMDEMVAYVRQFEPGRSYAGGSFDAVLSFIQALTESVSASPRTVLLASLPESKLEVGGDRGARALEALEKYFGRIEAIWKPVATEEAFEIVRRRLFSQQMDTAARDAVCRAFAELYRQHPDQFPSAASEAGYLRRLQDAYPIHPEVFERLYEDWASLERFQRTRGVLRLMAQVIHRLWQDDSRDLLILPGALPLYDPTIRNELIRYLPQGWEPVLERDVDGPRAEPSQLDTSTPVLGAIQAARRTARTVFLGSAPSVAAQTVRGINAERVRLGAVQPDQSIGHYDDALRKLSDRLHHLYSGNDRYWFDLRPNLRREMEERMGRFTDKEHLLPALSQRLRRMLTNGPFKGIHVFAPHGDISDDYELRLVVLPPDAGYKRKDGRSPALAAAAELLGKRGEQPRVHQNRLLFLAAELDLVSNLKQQCRRYLAWASIVEDIARLNLDQHQTKEAKDSQKEAEERLRGSLRETYRWVLAPAQDGVPGNLGKLFWEAEQVPSGSANLTEAIERILSEHELLIGRWSPIHLAEMLKTWFWKDGQPDVNGLHVWQQMCNYVYLPRLVDSTVFQNAMGEGIKSRDFFGFAVGKENERYRGLLFGESGGVYLDGSGLLVDPAVAKRAKDRIADQERGSQTTGSGTGGSGVGTGTGTNTGGTTGGTGGIGESETDQGDSESATDTGKPPPPTRFYGAVELDAISASMDFANIVNEVVQHFSAKVGSKVTISVEINAEHAGGYDEQVQRTVKTNCGVLKFETYEFER